MSDTLIKELNQGVLLLKLNRPEKKNAFNSELWGALSDALMEAREDDDVNVVVLTGAGKEFSSGQDLTSPGTLGGADYKTCEDAMAVFDKPLIGVAKGVAVGGGATTLFFTDILYVGSSLRMRIPFTSLGLAPEFASSYMLQAKIGTQRAAELMFTSEWIDADKAVESGIARQKFDDDILLDKALEKAAEIAKWPAIALQETKRCMMEMHKKGIENALAVERDAMTRRMGSPENIEAIMAFMQKREPDFNKLKNKG